MNKFDNNIQLSENRSSATSIFLILFLSLFGFMVVGPFLGMLISIIFYNGDIVNFPEAMSNPIGNPNVKIPLYVTQGFATFTGMILVPILYLWKFEKKSLSAFFQKQIPPYTILLSMVIVITFMFVNSIFIEWNAEIDLPSFMSGFENWARRTEDYAAELTQYLTTFDNFSQFVVAFIVIAILPAIGEELVFRGLLQNQFHQSTKNIHLAIWVSAILFSAIHMQFFGFLPRILLGALFGYLYYWSGNLIIPIAAHFANNGLSIVLIYLYNKELIETNITETETAPLYAVGIFVIITALLLYYFRNTFLKSTSST